MANQAPTTGQHIHILLPVIQFFIKELPVLQFFIKEHAGTIL